MIATKPPLKPTMITGSVSSGIEPLCTQYYTRKSVAPGQPTQLESVLEDYLKEKGLWKDFNDWLDENYPSDLSKCGVE